ncbi:MAG TPA: hypothetical protein PK253_19070 [Spirochaetota bacterium]|nr:hypothetical protein [Spirochaetota bacterium]HPQ55361.1 hypothetical protein [Spirochaetota bacterium]
MPEKTDKNWRVHIIGTVMAVSIALFSGCAGKGADTKQSARVILKNNVTIEHGLEFLDAACEKNPDGTCKTGYKWDDGSYYAFTIGTKNAMGDIGSLIFVKKNTTDIYKLDLEKDVSGNTLKKYQP